MSWQRILETARRNGFPIIVTDVAGREPMVVMPLDTYEALTSQGENGLEDFGYQSYPEEPGFRTEEEPILNELEEDTREKAEPTFVEAQVESGDGLALEDRFFLEPVEDQEN